MEIDECKGRQCGGNSTCLDRLNGFECKCAEGWLSVGLNKPCETAPCNSLGQHTPSPGKCECNSNEGWDGAVVWNSTHWAGSCYDKDECADEPCGEGSICVNERGHYSCACLPGWSGGGKNRRCTDGSASCNGVGQVGERGTGECVCRAGFSGTPSWNGTHWSNPCRDIDECENVDCGGGVQCENKINSYFCNCANSNSDDKMWIGGGKDKTCEEYVYCNTDAILDALFKLPIEVIGLCASSISEQSDENQCKCLTKLTEEFVSPFKCRANPNRTETVVETWHRCQSCKSASGCDRCYDFSKTSPRTVDVCTKCTGWGQTDCTMANCTLGYHDFDPTNGKCSKENFESTTSSNSEKKSDSSKDTKETEGTTVVIMGGSIAGGGILLVGLAVLIGAARMRRKVEKNLIEQETAQYELDLERHKIEPELGSEEMSQLAEQAETDRLGSTEVVALGSSLYGMNLAQPKVPLPIGQRTFRDSNFRLFYNAGAFETFFESNYMQSCIYWSQLLHAYI